MCVRARVRACVRARACVSVCFNRRTVAGQARELQTAGTRLSTPRPCRLAGPADWTPLGGKTGRSSPSSLTTLRLYRVLSTGVWSLWPEHPRPTDWQLILSLHSKPHHSHSGRSSRRTLPGTNCGHVIQSRPLHKTRPPRVGALGFSLSA